MMFNTKLLLLPIVAQMVKNLPTMQERRGTDAFELWCWRRLLRVPGTVRRSNQSILKEISPGISLEGLILKLQLQYFGHLMRRADLFEKTLMLGNICLYDLFYLVSFVLVGDVSFEFKQVCIFVLMVLELPNSNF